MNWHADMDRLIPPNPGADCSAAPIYSYPSGPQRTSGSAAGVYSTVSTTSSGQPRMTFASAAAGAGVIEEGQGESASKIYTQIILNSKYYYYYSSLNQRQL
ncbi:unnamed protein product [Protopolystoma xenopodis]|uniref:Uncharacterized protein n=1 Tax=Protopolystoma xenopodis TaxID=117903 RepID=A0A3S5CRK2_9PLAT|nr:unnamed protein product [Protopolystoma xenopodis]